MILMHSCNGKSIFHILFDTLHAFKALIKKQFFKDTKNPLFDDASSPIGCRNEQLYDF